MKVTDLVLLSGGLDSSVLAYQLANKGKSLRAIYIDTGFKPALNEKASAKHVADKLNIHLEIVEAPGLLSMTSAFYPTDFIGLDEWDKSRPLDPVPIPYVTGFAVPVAIATFYAALAGIKTLNVGVLKDQVDTRTGLSNFLSDWPTLSNHLNPNAPVQIAAPFKGMTKAEVIKTGASLGVALDRTWTCYRGEEIHCNRCGGCAARQSAFREANVNDATSYQNVE